MSEIIEVKEPLILNTDSGKFEDWLKIYFKRRHPPEQLSVHSLGYRNGTLIRYHAPPDGRISFYVIDVDEGMTIHERSYPPHWKDYFEELMEEALRQLSLTPRQKPPHPPLDAPSDSWFDWYHVVTDELGYRMGLEDLAIEMGLSYGRVRHLHADYMEDHREIEETETAQK